jgi:murein L,D-transpeptidase YcbB/YkuD
MNFGITLSRPAGRALSLTLLALSFLSPLACMQPKAVDQVAAEGIQSSLQRLVPADSPGDYGHDAGEIYQATGFSPLWIRKGHPTPAALALIQAFADSAQKGLKPEDYESSKWPQRMQDLQKSRGDATAIATFDQSLTLDTLRYVANLRIGRANPTPLPFAVTDGQTSYNLAQFVLQKVAPAANVSLLLDGIEPSYSGYKRTRDALQAYIAFAARDQQPPLPLVSKAVHPGGSYPGLQALTQRLQLIRDLPADAQPAGDGKYDGAVVVGVKHFQARHGLTANGELNKETIAALNTPLAQRVTQLEDALERWRWLPSNYPQLPVAVNLPEFVLRVFADDHHILLRSNVVVGKAFGHQSPVFAKEIRYIIFRPYWNVPLSITRSEIIPHIQRNGGYLAHKRLEVTDQSGHVVTDGAVTAGMLAQLRTGRLMVRQRPGPTNALGLIKFIFPNADNVYLHSTPAPQLFSRARRDFSHGCIRVEKPAELAAWLLRDQPQWTLDAINAAMQSGKDDVQITLTHPVPVVIVYITAVVEEDDEIYFFDDIYGLNRKLEAVLSKGPPYR